jgi:hypothetical protein
MNATVWTFAIANGAQVVAIGIGGAWAYYKFIRGRTFHKRAEVTITSELVRRDAFFAVRAATSLVNTGGSNLPLRVKIVRVYAFAPDDVDEQGRPRWDEVVNAPIFQDHEHIEAQETIRDDILVAIPAPVISSAVALRASCFVYERRKKPGGIQWTAHSIIPLDKPRRGTIGDEDRDLGSRPAQREADEGTIRRAEQQSAPQREASEEEIERAERDIEGTTIPSDPG